MLKTVNEIVESDPQFADLKNRFPYNGNEPGASWFQESNAAMLNVFLPCLQPERILEVGSWMGASARFLALNSAAKHIVCVDHWDWKKVENYREGFHPDSWMKNMYEHFLANVLHTNIGDRIAPLRRESRPASVKLMAQYGPGSFDLVYIDAAHKTEAAHGDILDYRPFVRKGGVLCGDDWAHNLPGEYVRVAVKRYAASVGATAFGYGNFWWMHF